MKMPVILYRIGYKIKEGLRNIKWFFQRGVKGYCDADLWNIDTWFCKVMKPMLIEFRKYNNGIFNQLYSKYDHDEAVRKQDEILRRMIDLVDGMNFEEHENCDNIEDCKDEFFELFSKYFYELWW